MKQLHIGIQATACWFMLLAVHKHMMAKSLKDEDTIIEVNKIESSDDDDYMGELDEFRVSE
jgi:hypothetical protein